VENLERMNKQTSVEIRNIPVQGKESKEDLLSLVKKVGEVVNVTVISNDIRDVFRLDMKKELNKPVVVEFSAVLLKENILTSIKAYNKVSKDNKLNTRHINIGGQPKPIFVVECLTQNARKVYYLAREFCRNYDYVFCWTAHGKVFVRKREGTPSYRIDSQADLDTLLSDK
jgi:hypothetical protein